MNTLLSGNLISDIPLSSQRNLEELRTKLELLEAAWGKTFVFTSVFRSIQHHIDVYRTKALRERKPFSVLQVPMGSKHLTGQAADIEDKDGSLYKWAIENQEILEKIGLWCEKNTQGWLHCQTVPPKSGNRFFLP